MALETWWLTPISLMKGNVRPEFRTDRKGVEKEYLPSGPPGGFSYLPAQGRFTQPDVAATTLSTQRLATLLGSKDWASCPPLQLATPPWEALRTRAGPSDVCLPAIWAREAPLPTPASTCPFLYPAVLEPLSPPSWLD